MLRLPGELRNRIYSFVFEGYDAAVVMSLHLIPVVKFSSHSVPYFFAQPQWLGILRVCRDLRAETVLLPYSLTTFRYDEFGGFRLWFRELPRVKKNSLNRVSVVLHRTTNIANQPGLRKILGEICDLLNNKVTEVILHVRAHCNAKVLARKDFMRGIAQEKGWKITAKHICMDLCPPDT